MAYHQSRQPCDSYFVEGHDDFRNRDVKKVFTRRKQEAMADELSRQACETYMEDIVDHMKHMEVNSPGFHLPTIKC
jgi:hypothetical protein